MNYSPRKNGQTMASFRVRVHVPVDVPQFIREHTGWTKARTDAWIIERWMELVDDWKVLVILADGRLDTYHMSDAENEEVTAVYVGPEIVVTR